MKQRRIAMAVVALVALATVSWLLFFRAASAEDLAAAGTVEATGADLGFQLPGRIATVAVEEGEHVAAGDVLAELDAAELEAAHAAALAQAATARAGLAELEEGARPEERTQARAALSAAEQRLEEARRELERTRRLEAGGAVSRETLEQATTAYEVLRAQAVQAREQLDLVSAGPRQERIDAARAQVAAAEAGVQQAAAQLGNATIHAPFTGIVTVRHREPGETVAAGQPVLTLMNPADRWVRIYVREDRVGQLALGQSARITSDSHPDSVFRGEIVHIAAQAEFTPRNVQTAEERVKLVYAVKVQITGDRGFALKPGVPADVTLEIQGR